MSLLEQLRGSRAAPQPRGSGATLVSEASMQNPLTIPSTMPEPFSRAGIPHQEWQGTGLGLQTGRHPGWQRSTQAGDMGIHEPGIHASTVLETAMQSHVQPVAPDKRLQQPPSLLQEAGIRSFAKPSTEALSRWLRGESVPPAALLQLQSLPDWLQGQIQVVCNRAHQSSQPSEAVSHSLADSLATNGSSITHPCSAMQPRASLQARCCPFMLQFSQWRRV